MAVYPLLEQEQGLNSRKKSGTSVEYSAWIIALWMGLIAWAPAGTFEDAVEALGYSELADALPQSKAESLAKTEVSDERTLSEVRALAVMSLFDAPLQPEALQRFVEAANRRDPAYMGNLGEASLVSRLATVWESLDSGEDTEFTLALRDVVAEGITNGYNITTSEWPEFEERYHLVYGHSDLRHAQQLLLLMGGAGMGARIGFSTKTSAYLHRSDWGEAPESAYELDDGQMLIEAREFDVHFEFGSEQDKKRFSDLIDRYAKREENGQEGLIHGAWWQPYYRSLTPRAGFHEVSQILVTARDEKAVLVVLPDDARAMAEKLESMNEPWSVTSEPVWVNPAFYRYVKGDYR